MELGRVGEKRLEKEKRKEEEDIKSAKLNILE